MGLGIAEALDSLLGERRTRFVFPSEVCAEDWLARSLRSGRSRALEADRFLGWDRLKEEAARAEGRAPADDPLRRIFAAGLLAENARKPFLSAILPEAYASEWRPFAGYLSSRLPALGRLPLALRAAGPGAEGDPAAADWLAVRARYEAFLASIGRFEPAYEPRALRDLGGATVIFFPELVADFEEYREALESSPSVRLVGLPATRPGEAEARLRRPRTALAELRETLSEAGRLLDSGLAAADIAITVAGLERYRPYLEREAALLSVPIALRSGSSLDATPGGRLFAALRDAHSSGFSYDSLRDLLLSPAWPWREAETGRALMAEGQRLHAVASWPEGRPGGGPSGGAMADAWERSLSGPLLPWYRKLKSRVSAIASAKSFGALLRAYGAFKSDFLSSEGWDEAADLTLARCVVELESLARAEAEAGLEAPDALGILMRSLEARPYVHGGGGGGIPVYDWRVAAGSFPDRHFVLGASQEGLSVPIRAFDFLGEALRGRIGAALYRDPEAPDRDSAPDFIRAYAGSGASVSFSCPVEGWDGEEAVHGFLLSASTEERPGPSDAAYREEAAWLSGRGPEPERLHRVQLLGQEAADEARPAAAGEGAFLEPPTAASAAARLERPRRGDPGGAGRRSLDSTSIDMYLSCPYAYLYLRLLGAGPESSGIEFVDALFLGDAYHEALALLFERIKAEDGAFRAERVEAYRGFLGPCLGEAFAAMARSRGPFVAVILEAYRGRLEGYLSGLLDAEAERFAGLEVGAIEEELELEYPGLAGGIVLRGRIDRISRSERGAVIIDYKKGRVPERAAVAPDDSGAIAEAQLPCYLRLVSANAPGVGGAGSPAADAGAALDSAWYLSIEGHGRRPPGSAVCAYGGSAGAEAYVPREGLGPFLEAFDAALGLTARGIEAGAYPLAPKEAQKEACRECGARGICRERYALRFGSARLAGAAARGGGAP